MPRKPPKFRRKSTDGSPAPGSEEKVVTGAARSRRAVEEDDQDFGAGVEMAEFEETWGEEEEEVLDQEDVSHLSPEDQMWRAMAANQELPDGVSASTFNKLNKEWNTFQTERRTRLKKGAGDTPYGTEDDSIAAPSPEAREGERTIEEEWAQAVGDSDASDMPLSPSLGRRRVRVPREEEEEYVPNAEVQKQLDGISGWGGLDEERIGKGKHDKKARRKLMIARAIQKEVAKALGMGELTKFKPELRALVRKITITDVAVSEDLAAATLLWSTGDVCAPEEIYKMSKKLKELCPLMRAVVAKKVNLRRCPEIELRPDPGWEYAYGAHILMDKFKAREAEFRAAGINVEELKGFREGGASGGGFMGGSTEDREGFSTDHTPGEEYEKVAREVGMSDVRMDPLPPKNVTKVNPPAARSQTTGAAVQRLLRKIRDAPTR